jgi:glycosyltransferase involved in cell wall biosynthesis
MNVLYRIPYPRFFSQHDSVGGHITHSLGIVQGMVRQGHTVTVLAHEGESFFNEVGAGFVRVDGAGRGFFGRQRWLWRFFCESKRLLSGGQYDFSYTRYSASATPHLWSALGRETTPNVIEINTIGAQQLGLLKPIDKRIIQLATVPVVISESLQQWVHRNVGVEAASRVEVVQNGVAEDRFRPIHDGGKDPVFRLAFAGLLKENYGLECVIEAAEKVADERVSFHIFGAGPAKASLHRQSERVDNFVLEGEVPFSDVPDRLCEMDALLYTTSPHYSYQSPTKLFEYMAVGRPIVAARTPQTADILEEGRLGRLFDIESSDALVDAVREVRDTYDDALQRARRAQDVAENQHMWTSRVQQILDAIKRHGRPQT